MSTSPLSFHSKSSGLPSKNGPSSEEKSEPRKPSERFAGETARIWVMNEHHVVWRGERVVGHAGIEVPRRLPQPRGRPDPAPGRPLAREARCRVPTHRHYHAFVHVDGPVANGPLAQAEGQADAVGGDRGVLAKDAGNHHGAVTRRMQQAAQRRIARGCLRPRAEHHPGGRPPDRHGCHEEVRPSRRQRRHRARECGQEQSSLDAPVAEGQRERHAGHAKDCSRQQAARERNGGQCNCCAGGAVPWIFERYRQGE